MKSFKYVIRDKVGIHARPAGMIVKEAKKYESEIKILKGEETANAVNLMQLMSMGIRCGDEVEVQVSGSDEDAACTALEAVLNSCL